MVGFLSLSHFPNLMNSICIEKIRNYSVYFIWSINPGTGHRKLAVLRNAFGSQANVRKTSDGILLLLRRVLQSIKNNLQCEKKCSCKYKCIIFVSYCFYCDWLLMTIFVPRILIKLQQNAVCIWIDFHPGKLFITSYAIHYMPVR